MRISSVDLPLRLLEARRSGRLVIFAGAGVSRPAPSNLPDFRELVVEVAEGGFKIKEEEPPDYSLGRLAQLGIHVHDRAARILSRPDSLPNELHRLTVRLFPRAEDVRIVTTNFDLHFEPALAEHWPSPAIEIYAAPALPVGSRFAGLAYLHGRLGKRTSDLVLTDGDFGRAYLTEGWARRFLSEVFATYDVLFVGYSHQDVVLSYLARGLPVASDRVRFALTGTGDRDRWQFLGITPIEYDPAEHHAVLPEALRGWLDLEGRGALSHEREVQQLVARSPQALTEQEEDYLLFCLRDLKLAQFFFRHAHGPEWLTWAGERSVLSPLFSPADGPNAGADAAEWFARDPLSERGAVARELAHKANYFTRRLWTAIAHAVWSALAAENLPSEAAPHAAQWLALLERHGVDTYHDDVIDYWLKSLSAKDHTFLAVQLFAYLTRPIGAAEKVFLPRDNRLDRVFRPTVRIRGDGFWLRHAWASLFAPNLDRFSRYLAPLVFEHLQQANLLLRSQGVASDSWDPMAYGRSAIEIHEQNAHGLHDAFDVLIDAARDILDWMIHETPDTARHYIEVGLSSDAPLVRRLCIYGLARHPEISANRKITTVVERGWLGQWLLRHETFLLLRESYEKSGPAIRRTLIRAARRTILGGDSGASDEPKKLRARHYDLFTLLMWLEKADPSCPIVAQALTNVRQKHPDFEPRDYPDFGHWSHGVHSVATESPISLDAVLRLGPAQWLDEFTKVSTAEREQQAFASPSQGFLLETNKAAAQDFIWGLELLRHLAAVGIWEHSAWHYVLRSWAGQPFEDSRWTELLSFIQQHKEFSRHASDVADLLLRRMENRDSVATESMVTQSFRLAEVLWPTLGPEQEGEDKLVNDWVQFGINRAGGKLGLFAVHALSRLRGIRRDDWKGIPSQFRSLLERMANAAGNFSPLGRVMLCSQLHFFFELDADWTKANLFPLFDWSRSRQVAEQAWHGFLTWGRAPRELLADFMPYVIDTFNYLPDLRGERRRFSEHLAWIAYGSKPSPLEAGWIREYLRKAAPEDRKEWTSALGNVLGGIDEAERRALWDSWLKQYIELRLDSEIPITDDEWGSVIEWSFSLADLLPEVVMLLVRRPVGRPSRGTLYYRLEDRKDLLRYPDAFADLLAYLLAAEDRLYGDCKYVGEIIEKLLDATASRVKLRSLAERLGELGCGNAQELASRIDSST